MEKGIFALVKTSNPSGGEFQDLKVYRKRLYERVADKVDAWGAGSHRRIWIFGGRRRGGRDISRAGPVPAGKAPDDLFPGAGLRRPGATAADIAGNFDANGLGAVINSSRGILLAYKKPQYAGMNFKRRPGRLFWI